MLTNKLKGISRRDLLKLTGQYGLSSTLLAAGALTGAVSFPRLAEAANSTYTSGADLQTMWAHVLIPIDVIVWG